MINVLLNAYAVSPNWGSEPGLGWNWVVNLSKYCNVFVITEGEWREDIENALECLPHKKNIHFYYNPLPSEIRNMCWNQGDWRFYRYYRQWQERTLDIARDIISRNRIDIIHQLNMIGFREPGSLWKINGIPFVWGPVGGYGWTTLRYLDGYPLGLKMKLLIKNIINILQGRFYPLSNSAMNKAACIIAANSKVHHYIQKNFREDVILLNETGCYEKSIPIQEKKSDLFRNLWVGKFDYRKQLDIAIRTISLLKRSHPKIMLDIIGDTENANFKRLSKLSEKLKLGKYITWHGKIPNSEVHQLMQESDIFLFTSIDEGTPHVVLEAIQNNLPIICFDTCGQGDVVNEAVGIKIQLSDSRQSPVDFAKSIASLIDSRNRLESMKQACTVRQKELSWDLKIKSVINIYNALITRENASWGNNQIKNR